MKIKLNITKSIHDNAAIYYEEAKRIRKKIEGLKKAIAESEKELEETVAEEKKKKESVRVKREKKWFEKFHWFRTAGGRAPLQFEGVVKPSALHEHDENVRHFQQPANAMRLLGARECPCDSRHLPDSPQHGGRLAIGGKDAKQNDLIFAKHMDDNDLFFHADIQGASAVILKDGVNASDDELAEVAQFAASFSNAWKNANASCDVYAVRKSQLSKHASGGYIPTGGFGISGERKWFRNTKLGLRLGTGEDGLEIIPTCSKRKLENEVELSPARTGKEKGELAKGLAKRLNVHPDDLLQILPSGKSKTKVNQHC